MTIETATGRQFDYSDPEIDVGDVAHALSNLCRFGGHSDRFYSVAEHSVLVSRLVDRDLRMPALFHDAHEAYLGDLPRPLKRLIGPKYGELAREIDEAVGDLLGIAVDTLHDDAIKRADMLAYAWEATCLMPGGAPFKMAADLWDEVKAKAPRLLCLEPCAAKELFLEAYEEQGSLVVDCGEVRRCSCNVFQSTGSCYHTMPAQPKMKWGAILQ